MALSDTDWREWLAIQPRVGLGTAQLGFRYGVANQTGMPSHKQAQAILNRAWKMGVRCFDTAKAYGEAEARIGRYLKPISRSERPLLVTKVSDLSNREDHAIESIRQCGGHLGTIWGLLLHDESLLFDKSGQWQSVFQRAKLEGLTRYVGVSLYTVKAARRALECEDIDIIQLPSSCMDRRFLRAGVYECSVRQRVALFARSVFLQGLIGMTPSQCPPAIPRAQEALLQLYGFCRARGIAPRLFALSYVLRRMNAAIALFGAESSRQVASNVRMAVLSAEIPAKVFQEWDALWPEDCDEFIDPRSWPNANA